MIILLKFENRDLNYFKYLIRFFIRKSLTRVQEGFPLPGKLVARVKHAFPVTRKAVARVRQTFGRSRKSAASCRKLSDKLLSVFLRLAFPVFYLLLKFFNAFFVLFNKFFRKVINDISIITSSNFVIYKIYTFIRQ